MNQYSSSQFQNITLSNETTLLNKLESLSADNMEAKQPIDLEAPQSIGESFNNNSPESNTDTSNSKRTEGKFVSQNVFNLSDRVLTENKINVLNTGLNFVPTPERLDRLQIKNDLEKLGRDIKLRMFYQNDLSPSFSAKPAFKVPSSWTPPIRDVHLELYLSEIEDKLIIINESGKSYPNLSKDERETLKSLMNDNDIIIKPADKGSAVVIWSKQDYLLEASNQMSDTNVYCKSNSNTLQKVNSEIKSVLRDMFNLKEIDQKIMNYLTVKKPQIGRFYLPHKIHKRTMNVPGRPVISNNGTATERISSFLDFHLKNIIPTIPHILEHTRDFLYRIEQLQNTPEGTLPVSFDVVGLYSRIPHDEGLKIMKKYLDKREDQSITSENLYKLAEIVLKQNYFEFGQDVYQQILGTATGTKFKPPYANIFMAGLEEEIIKNPKFKPFLSLRHLDDIFCLWTEGVDKLKEFFNYHNEIHSSIKFIMEYS